MKWQWKPGWLEIVFVFLLLCDVGLSLLPGAAGAGAVLTVACYVTGLLVLVRFVRKNLKPALWRLRNRLIVSYMFIAVVPIALLMLLVVNAGRVLMGQVAVYLVTTELERRMAGASAPPRSRSGLRRQFSLSRAPLRRADCRSSEIICNPLH